MSVTINFARFFFKLRRNISLEGDISLAKLELEALLRSKVSEVQDLDQLEVDCPELTKWHSISSVQSHVRSGQTKGFAYSGPLQRLFELIRTVSFIQDIYVTCDYSHEAEQLILSLEDSLGRVCIWQRSDKELLVRAIPHYAIIELSEVIARKSADYIDTLKNLNNFLEGLTGRDESPKCSRLVSQALLAEVTTSHLTHDIHYYKAKFFPRMARALINYSAANSSCNGRPHRVIDNFSGSGTTMLEAASLGIPSVGLDIDPLSVLIASAKLEALDLDNTALAEDTQRIRMLIGQAINGQLNLFSASDNVNVRSISFPKWLMKNRRMSQAIANELSSEIFSIRTTIAKCLPQHHLVLKVLLSDAISRKIRMRFLGTGVGRFSLTFAKKSLISMFIKSADSYAKVAANCHWLKKNLKINFARSDIIVSDTREIPNTIGSFDILVTSPPYLPASSGRESYAKARTPSLIALGMRAHDDVDTLVDDSIGSMRGTGIDLSELTPEQLELFHWLRNDDLRSIKAEPTARYFLDIRKTFKEMMKILEPGAVAVIVSGKTSTFYEFSTRKTLFVVNAAKILAREAEFAGFAVERLEDVQVKKANMNARPRSLDDYFETLIVLRCPVDKEAAIAKQDSLHSSSLLLPAVP